VTDLTDKSSVPGGLQEGGTPEWDIVLVTHNSAGDLRHFWLDARLDGFARVIVVDNGSSDDSVVVARQFADVVIESENLGLSRANNAGLAACTSDIVAFCNPDVAVSAIALASLQSALRQRGGLVAPRLLEVDGSLQPNGRAWPSPWVQVLRKVRPRSERVRRYLWPNHVDWVTGAFVAGERKHFEALGGWPDDHFLYFEDVEICVRAAEAGLPVSLVESATAVHGWKQSSASLLSFGARQHLKSFFQFYSHHPGLIIGIGPSQGRRHSLKSATIQRQKPPTHSS
jgi:N-acetylglucosaminyl-diphospho-decaprenol L-rhamnosyltransferase